MIIKWTDCNCSDAHPKQSVCVAVLIQQYKQSNAEVVSSSLTWSTFRAFLYQGKSHKALYMSLAGVRLLHLWDTQARTALFQLSNFSYAEFLVIHSRLDY